MQDRNPSHTTIQAKDVGIPLNTPILLQEQQKVLRGRFGCHHLYPMP